MVCSDDLQGIERIVTIPLPRTDTPETFEDTSFVSGDSPVTLDCNAALG